MSWRTLTLTDDKDILLHRHLTGPPTVPCNGCTECCKGPDRKLYMDIVPDEDLTRYTLTWTPEGRPLLATAPNGDCIYLDADRCSIYDHRPAICRAFDCRDFLHADWQLDRIKAAARRRL